jgi:hypothetical protein
MKGKNKIIFLIFLILSFIIYPPKGIFSQSTTDNEFYEFPSETKSTEGWRGSLAFNSDDNTWLVVSESASTGIHGRIMSNDNLPISKDFLISSPSQGQSLAPKAVYSPDIKKYIVVWTTADANIYARFVNPDGSMEDSAFLATKPLPGAEFFYPNSKLQYDKKNKRAVLAWEHREPNVMAYLTWIGIDKSLGPIIKVGFDSMAFNGAPSLAVNEDGDEYCLAYQYEDRTKSEENALSSIAVRSVNAKTGELGPQTFATKSAYGNATITYNTQEKKYFLVWFNGYENGISGKILNSCNGEDGEPEFVIREGLGAQNLEYNPTSNTYAIIGQDWQTIRNYFLILDSQGNLIEEGYLFSEGQNGNYSPVAVANTNDGTYAMTSSQDYAVTNFISGVGSSTISYQNPGPLKGTKINLDIPTEGLPQFGDLILAIFNWSLTLLGIIVFVMIFYGGFILFTAAGNPSKISEAKSQITNAIIGALILLASYMILTTINPDLVNSQKFLPKINNKNNNP